MVRVRVKCNQSTAHTLLLVLSGLFLDRRT